MGRSAPGNLFARLPCLFGTCLLIALHAAQSFAQGQATGSTLRIEIKGSSAGASVDVTITDVILAHGPDGWSLSIVSAPSANCILRTGDRTALVDIQRAIIAAREIVQVDCLNAEPFSPAVAGFVGAVVHLDDASASAPIFRVRVKFPR